jgi:recombinase
LAHANAHRGAMVQKQAADLRAKALAPVIRDIRAAGHTTLRGICRELNRIEVPTARGGRWHVASVHRLLTRLR